MWGIIDSLGVRGKYRIKIMKIYGGMAKYGFLFSLGLLFTLSASAQLSERDIAQMKNQAKSSDWTFTVGETPATSKPISELCGLSAPKKWKEGARFQSFAEKAELPSSFDWREQNGCTPIKNQGHCGSCWAFATIGALECNIKIRDGATVALSEQWLVNCSQDIDEDTGLKWGCGGGWWAHDYFTGAKKDPCGGSGAVLTDASPYTASDGECGCPYSHVYAMDSWAYIGAEDDIAPTEAIKQAIYNYGPVCVGVFVGNPFAAYTGGVFNVDDVQEPNHAVLLVGWDDSQGSEGVWILRNSWASDWGEDGYMRIEYGVSNVGYAACFVDYAGKGKGVEPVITSQPEDAKTSAGWRGKFSVAASGVGDIHYQWEHDGEPVGDDAATLSIPVVTQSDAGEYLCIVSDARGEAISETVNLVIDDVKRVPGPKPAPIILAIMVCASAILSGRRNRLPDNF
jgi:C1A family cysteine protease